MKRSLTLLLASLMLVFSLTACGCTATPQDTASQNGSSTQDGSGNQNDSAMIGNDHGSNSGNNGTNHQNNGNNGNSLLDDAANAVEEGVDDVKDAVDGTNKNTATGGVTYDQMLQNGNVHDKDGDLTDHENSTTSNNK